MEFGGLRTVRKFSRGWKVEPGELRMLWGEGGGATFPDNLGFHVSPYSTSPFLFLPASVGKMDH